MVIAIGFPMRLCACRATLKTILIRQEELYRIDHLFQSENARVRVRAISLGSVTTTQIRTVVNFDRTAAQVFTTLDQLVGVDGSVPSYPPYNIERSDENA